MTVLFFFVSVPTFAHNMPLGASFWCFGKDHITAVIELNDLLFADIKDIKEGHYNLDTTSDEELHKILVGAIQPYIDRKLTIIVNEKNYPVKVTKLVRNENNLFKLWLSVDNIRFNRTINPVRIDYRLLFDETDNSHVNLANLYLTDASGDDLQHVLDFAAPNGQYSFDRDNRSWEVSIKGSPAIPVESEVNTRKSIPSDRIGSVVGKKKTSLTRNSAHSESLLRQTGQTHAANMAKDSAHASAAHGKDSVQPARMPLLATIWQFTILGIEHILTGYDHMAFLLALIVIGLSIREVLKIITAFTVAHSITLLLAAMRIVSLNSRIVESVIAFSICYVALENLFKKKVDYRWLITFCFGLVHGFGFASVLQELIAGTSNLLVSVISFNFGVEIGQLMIFLVSLPALHLLKKNVNFRIVTVGTSLAIFILGFSWLIERGFNLKFLPI